MASTLRDRTVVITRAGSQNEPLRGMLEERGARVVEVPLIAIVEPDDEGRERDGVLQDFVSFDWIIVTSPNGAERVAPFIAAANAAGDGETFPNFAVTGDATARSLGIPATLVARPSRAEVLAEIFPEGTGRVLLVQGDLADDLLVSAVSAKGWDVTRVVAYRTVRLRPGDELREPALSADVLLLASGSAATAWFDAFGTATPPCVVAIGPSTAKVARTLGIDLAAVAEDHTLESLVAAAENSLPPQ